MGGGVNWGDANHKPPPRVNWGMQIINTLNGEGSKQGGKRGGGGWY